MADEENEFSGDGEGEAEEEGEGEAIEALILEREQAGESLSLLCKTSNGLAHAYVRMDLRNKLSECVSCCWSFHGTILPTPCRGLTDISVIASFVYIRYVVSRVWLSA